MFPGAGWAAAGGGLALNQLLVQMDGIGEAPAMRRFCTNRFNTILDAMYLIPAEVGRVSLRLPAPRAGHRAGVLHRRHQRAHRPS